LLSPILLTEQSHGGHHAVDHAKIQAGGAYNFWKELLAAERGHHILAFFLGSDEQSLPDQSLSRLPTKKLVLDYFDPFHIVSGEMNVANLILATFSHKGIMFFFFRCWIQELLDRYFLIRKLIETMFVISRL
jgi:hypothetical protein